MLPYLTQVPRILGQASEIETEFVREPYESRLVMHSFDFDFRKAYLVYVVADG